MRAIFSFLTERRTAAVALAVVIVAVGLALGLLPSASAAASATGLPASAESQHVADLLAGFPRPDDEYGIVVWSRRDGARLTAADTAAVESRIAAVAPLSTEPGSVRPDLAANRTAMLVELPVDAAPSNPAPVASRIREAASRDLPADLRAQLAGTVTAPGAPAPGAFDPAAGVIAVLAALLLFAVSRRLVLWLAQLVVLAAAGWLCIDIAVAVHGRLGAPLTADARDLLFGLIVGLGTVSCVALTARLRAQAQGAVERTAALRAAFAGAAPAVGASAILVAAGMLALLFGGSLATRAFGVSAAIGVVATAVLVLGALPALLAVLGRAVALPSGGSPAATTPGTARSLLNGIVIAAAACLIALPVLEAQLSAPTSTVTRATAQAQRTIDAAYGTGYGNQAIMLVPDFFAGETSTVAPTTLAMNFDTVHAVTRDGSSAGRTELIVAIDADPGSAQALATVRNIRASIARTGGLTAETLVGGPDAATLDRQAAAVADRSDILVVGIVGIIVLVLSLVALVLAIRRGNRPAAH